MGNIIIACGKYRFKWMRPPPWQAYEYKWKPLTAHIFIYSGDFSRPISIRCRFLQIRGDLAAEKKANINV